MAKKSKEIKFTQDELTSLEDLQSGYDKIKNSLGSLELTRFQTEKKLEQISNERFRLENEFNKLTELELKIVRELNEKYGPGNLDPTTGVFTPNN